MNVAEQELKAFRKVQEDLLSSEPSSLWRSSQERAESPEQKKQRQAQEFLVLPKDSKPSEESKGFSRRQFFQWGAAATALMTSVACTRRPKDYLVPYVNKPEGYTYGVPVWYASSTADGLGLLVKTREGRPIKVEGNPDHPGNLGGLGARGQASVLDLYNPDRVKAPLDIKTGQNLSWEEVDARVKEALSSASSGEVRVLMESSAGPSLERMLTRFSEKHSARVHRFSSLPAESMARAYELGVDRRVLPYHRFDLADVVVSVNADFLGTWLRPVEFAKQFASRRRVHDGELNASRLFVFESMFTTTGVSADHRAPILPSEELLILFALANELSTEISFDASLRQTFAEWSVDKVSEVTGVSAELLRETAAALLAARGKSLVVAGFHGPNSLELQLMALALNAALGNLGETISDRREILNISDSSTEFEQLVSDCQNGNVKVLFIQGDNPVYSRPLGELGRALEKVAFVVRISRDQDETAMASHLLLPESHFLETWGDAEAVSGFVSIQQPSIEPLFDTRSFGEMLSVWSSESSARDYRLEVQETWRSRFYDSNREFGDWWRWQLQLGALQSERPRRSMSPRWTSISAVLRNFSHANETGLELHGYESIQMGDGRFANNAWLQELPDPITKVVWTNFAAISPSRAKEEGLEQGDMVTLKWGDRSIELPVFIQPGISNRVVAAAVGYGREFAGRLGSGRGSNVFELARYTSNSTFQLSGQRVDLSKLGSKVDIPSTQHHFDLHGRDYDILHHTTLSKFAKDPKAAKKALKKIEHPDHSMYPANEHVYPGHRWGMSIDLNKCTGCQACVVACYSENNIAVVGPDQVEKGRHLAWLRTDLYYQGDETAPEAVYQPMLCQQCERAPCETVCPVLATVHSSDGLNDMVYNRCVGTRYCANNCPYKVRRFNYFDYSSKLAREIPVNEESPLSLMLNPDVTVRGRGVMEKCTFCVQRIRQGVAEIKSQMGSDYRHRIPDGHVQTACQQTCPSDAITFGDLNDPNSKVSEMAAKAQGFKVLAVLNTNPSVTYLPRVRNKGSEA